MNKPLLDESVASKKLPTFSRPMKSKKRKSTGCWASTGVWLRWKRKKTAPKAEIRELALVPITKSRPSSLRQFQSMLSISFHHLGGHLSRAFSNLSITTKKNAIEVDGTEALEKLVFTAGAYKYLEAIDLLRLSLVSQQIRKAVLELTQERLNVTIKNKEIIYWYDRSSKETVVSLKKVGRSITDKSSVLPCEALSVLSLLIDGIIFEGPVTVLGNDVPTASIVTDLLEGQKTGLLRVTALRFMGASDPTKFTPLALHKTEDLVSLVRSLEGIKSVLLFDSGHFYFPPTKSTPQCLLSLYDTVEALSISYERARLRLTMRDIVETAARWQAEEEPHSCTFTLSQPATFELGYEMLLSEANPRAVDRTMTDSEAESVIQSIEFDHPSSTSAVLRFALF